MENIKNFENISEELLLECYTSEEDLKSAPLCTTALVKVLRSLVTRVCGSTHEYVTSHVEKIEWGKMQITGIYTDNSTSKVLFLVIDNNGGGIRTATGTLKTFDISLAKYVTDSKEYDSLYQRLLMGL